MARHARRLILWTTGALLALALLALLGIALLFWAIDPDVFRGRIERAASDALGRRVELTGPLRWRPGFNFQVESRGGRIGNIAGFGPEPLASWSALRLGVALRPLLDRRLVVDRIELDGLRLALARGTDGANWELPAASATRGDSSLSLAVGGIRLRDAEVRFRDADSAQWSLTRLTAQLSLPANLDAPKLRFAGLEVRGRLSGPALQAEGVALQWSAPRLEFDVAARRITLPEWRLQWDEASASGEIDAAFGESPSAQGRLHLEAPSLRRLSQSVAFVLPATQDSDVFGPLRVAARFDARADAVSLRELDATLDSTRVTGQLDVPSLAPLALRFALRADAVDLDRYRTPADQPSTPLSLPLAQLRALDAKGSLVIERAALAGAAARELRIDVD